MAASSDAPPPYTDVTEPGNTTDDKPTKATVEATAAEEASFNQSFKPSTAPLAIKFKDITARHGTLINPTTNDLVYTSEHRYRKPTFTLNAPDGRTIATADSHTWSNKMDVSMLSPSRQDFTLLPRKLITYSVAYPSPAFGGQNMTWEPKRGWSRITWVLSDASGVAVARFVSTNLWSMKAWKEWGTLEFVEGKVDTEGKRDEVVAVGLAVIYRTTISGNAGAASAAAGAGPGAGAGAGAGS